MGEKCKKQLASQLGESRMLSVTKEELNREFFQTVGSGGRVVNKFSSPPTGILTEFQPVIYPSLYSGSGFVPSWNLFSPATAFFPLPGTATVGR
jgi:hypothetical protein